MSSDAASLGSPAPPRVDASSHPEVSVIVPVSERPGPLDRIYADNAPALRGAGIDFEFIFALEPWARPMAKRLAPLIDEGEPIRVLHLGQVVGESSLLDVAGSGARAPILVTLPAYARVQAEGLPMLIQAVREGCDLATGVRVPRSDSWINRLQNRAFHKLLRLTASGSFKDIASGVRAMKAEVLEAVPLYGDFFRFLPLLAQREGFRVEEVPIPQHPDDRRARIYSPGVYLRRLIDLLGIMFLVRFTQKPLRFFGLVGSGFALVGAAILGVLFVQRLGGQGIADRPVLLLGVLLLVLGVQSIAIGLIGEIIVHLGASRRRFYRLRDEPDE